MIPPGPADQERGITDARQTVRPLQAGEVEDGRQQIDQRHVAPIRCPPGASGALMISGTRTDDS